MELSDCSFGARIAELRTHSGYTLQELADQVGVSRAALWKWENESAIPRHERLNALSKAFGVSVDYLVAGARSAPSGVMERAEILHELIIEAKQTIATAAGIRPDRVTITLDY